MATNENTASAHTPGPWHVEVAPNGKPFVTNRDRQHVCTLYEGKPSERVAANARLIAAAPELLEALDYLLEQTVDMDLAVGNELTDREQEAREMALSAIAKANGNAA